MMILQWNSGARRHHDLTAICVILLSSICTSQVLAADNPRFVPSLMHNFPANASAHLEVLDEKSFGGLGDGGRRVLRKTKDKNKSGRKSAQTRADTDEETPPSNDKPAKKKDEDNYHVKYETKFAFQNVDEFGLKVKYNKTEHVFYGDTQPQAKEPQQDGHGCMDAVGRQFAVGQTSNHPGECSLRRCEPGGVFAVQSVCEYPAGQQSCAPDLSKPFPECCECGGGGGGGGGVDRLTIDGSIAPMVGEDSLEMIECRKMNFLDYEYVKPIEGMCINCYRGQGTYRYIQGCQRMDCDAFLPTDPTAPYPDCCPACVGERMIEPITDPAGPSRRMMNMPSYDYDGFDWRSSNEEDVFELPDSRELNDDPGEEFEAADTRMEEAPPEETKVSLSYAEPQQFARKLKTLQSRRRKF